MFNKNIFVGLLLSAVVISKVVSDDPEVNVTVNNIYLNVKGKSGAIAMFRRDKGMREKIIDIKMDSIYEVDGSGNKINEKGHSFNNFAKTNFTVSQLTSLKKYGLSAQVFSCKSSLDNGASLEAEFIMFGESNNITVESGETFEVVTGTVKFNVIISGWKFCGMQDTTCKNNGSYLDLLLDIKSGDYINATNERLPKKSTKSKGKKSANASNVPVTYIVSNESFATFSTMVLKNDNWTEMPSGYPKFEIQDGKPIYTCRFFASNSLIKYDPLIEVVPSTEPDAPEPEMSNASVNLNVNSATLVLSITILLIFKYIFNAD